MNIIITGLVADSSEENSRHFHSLMTNLSNSLDGSILHLPEKTAGIFTDKSGSSIARRSFANNFSRSNADDVKTLIHLQNMEAEQAGSSFFFKGKFIKLFLLYSEVIFILKCNILLFRFART
jgi:hypothetical protein